MSLSAERIEARSNLPKGWATCALQDVCSEFIGGGTPSREHPEYFGGEIVWLTPTEIPKQKIVVIDDSKEKLTADGFSKSSARFIPQGSVLLTSRASIGYVAIAGRELTTNQGFASIVCSKAIHNYYLAYWLWANKNLLEMSAGGTTFKEIPKSKLRLLKIPLPPLNEQSRIVSKIEELLTRLDFGIESLRNAQVELKRHRQSVLKAAFEGKLTKEWRKRRITELREIANSLSNLWPMSHKSTETSADNVTANLPETWRWETVSSIAESMKNGIYKEKSAYSDDGVACLRMYNIQDGRIIWKDIKRMRLSSEETAEYQMLQDDILVNRVNSRELVGKSACIPPNLETCVYESKNIRLRVNKRITDSRFVNYWLLLSGQRYFNRNAQQTVGMAWINQQQLGSMRIPIPLILEQREIAKEIDAAFSVYDVMVQTITNCLFASERLRSSILGTAFSGNFVSQEGNEEPATKLLDRIGQEPNSRLTKEEG